MRPLSILPGILVLLASPALADVVCGTWSASSLPNATGKGLTSVSASSSADVWAVGTGVYHWNGSTWAAVPAPGLGAPDTTLSAVAAVSPSLAWIAGSTAFLGTPQTLIERWDGAKWSVVPSPVFPGGSRFDAVAALGPNDAWAVGLRAGGLPESPATAVTLTAHWDGSSWTAVPSPNISNRHHELLDLAAIAPNDVWAVGSYRNWTEDFQTLILHWNGVAWSIVPSPNLPGGNSLSGVSAIASDDVWAVGGAWDGVTGRQIFLHWDGASWTQVNGLGGTTACAGCTGDVLAMGPNDVWAVGRNIGQWNGAAWRLVPDPTVPGATGLGSRSLARIADCEAWAVGGSFDADWMESALALRLTPGSGAINIAPVALATSTPSSGPGPLEVQFSSAGSHDPDGSIVSYLWNFGDGALSNSSEPHPVHTFIQTGALTYEVTLVVTDDKGAIGQASTTVRITPPMHVEDQTLTQYFVAGGSYAQDDVLITNAQEEPVAGASVVFEYSGPALGLVNGTTGDDGRVLLQSPVAYDNARDWCFKVISVSKTQHIYAAASNEVTEQCEVSQVVSTGSALPTRLALRASPNPWTGEARIDLALPASGDVWVAVHDVSGRMVRELASETLPAGDHILRWDGRDGAGRATAAGVYFVTATIGGERVTLRTLRMR